MVFDAAHNAVIYHDSLGTVVLITAMLAVGFISLGLFNIVKLVRRAAHGP